MRTDHLLLTSLDDPEHALAIPHRGNQPAGVVTASIGVAPLGSEGDVHAVIGEADRLLYEAKAAGRNLAVVCQAELACT